MGKPRSPFRQPKPGDNPIISFEHYQRPPRGSSLPEIRKYLEASVVGLSAAGLEELRAKFADTLRPYAIVNRGGTEVLNLGDGWRRYAVAIPQTAGRTETEAVLEAIRAMDSLFILEHQLAKQSGVNSELIASAAFALGCMHMVDEGVRPYVRYVNHSMPQLHGKGRPHAFSDEEIVTIDNEVAKGRSVTAILKTLNGARASRGAKDTSRRSVQRAVDDRASGQK